MRALVEKIRNYLHPPDDELRESTWFEYLVSDFWFIVRDHPRFICTDFCLSLEIFLLKLKLKLIRGGLL